MARSVAAGRGFQDPFLRDEARTAFATEDRFKGSKFREDALFYMAKNSHRFYSFEKAVRLYLSLARSFPKSTRVQRDSIVI